MISTAIAHILLTAVMLTRQHLTATHEPPPAGAPSQTADAEETLEVKLTRVGGRLAEVQTLRADFVQRKRTAMLKKPIESKGAIVCKGGNVLWRTSQPRPVDMLVTPAEVKIFYPQDLLVEVYPLDARFKDATGGPLPRLAQLRAQFDFAEIDPKDLSDSSDTTHLLALRLTPKSDELKKHLAQVRVLIDELVPCASRVILTDPDGDETDLRFLNIRANAGVSGAEVELALPGGVRVSHPLSGAANQSTGPGHPASQPEREHPTPGG